MSEQDVMALSGLRRLVLHARDTLAASTVQPPKEFSYNQHWRPPTIRRHAAMLLAEQVLTLVADCLPADGSLTADEAAQLRAALDGQLRAAAAERERAAAELAGVRAELERKTTDLEEAQDDAAAWEADHQNVFMKWEGARVLARNDVPAAVRFLLDGGLDEDETEPAS